MSSRIEAWLDQEDARLRDVIREHGWAIEYIGGGCCSVPGCDGGGTDEPPSPTQSGCWGSVIPNFSCSVSTCTTVWAC